MPKFVSVPKDLSDHMPNSDSTPVASESTTPLSDHQEQTVSSGSAETKPVDAFDARIRELAHHKWEAAGCPPGDGFDFWLEAEREINANHSATGTVAE